MKSTSIIATVSAVSGVSATQPQRKRRQSNNVAPAKVDTEKYDPFLGLPSDVIAEETQQYHERKLQETDMSLPLDLDGTDAPVATPVVTTDAPVASPGVATPVPTSWYPTYNPTAGSNDFAAAQGGVENGSSSISVGVTLLLGGVGVWMNMN